MTVITAHVYCVTPLTLTKKFRDRQCNLVSTFVSFTDTSYTDKRRLPCPPLLYNHARYYQCGRETTWSQKQTNIIVSYTDFLVAKLFCQCNQGCTMFIYPFQSMKYKTLFIALKSKKYLRQHYVQAIMYLFSKP